MVRTLVMLAVVTASLATGLPAAAHDAQLSYADVMAMPPEQRERTLAALSPDNRSAVMKQHLERWLDVHRPDLSSRAQALVREFIDSITPALYTTPPTEAARERQSLLAHRMACALGDDRAGTLTKLDSPPKRINRTWRDSTRQWIDWVVTCAVR